MKFGITVEDVITLEQAIEILEVMRDETENTEEYVALERVLVELEKEEK